MPMKNFPTSYDSNSVAEYFDFIGHYLDLIASHKSFRNKLTYLVTDYVKTYVLDI